MVRACRCCRLARARAATWCTLRRSARHPSQSVSCSIVSLSCLRFGARFVLFCFCFVLVCFRVIRQGVLRSEEQTHSLLLLSLVRQASRGLLHHERNRPLLHRRRYVARRARQSPRLSSRARGTYSYSLPPFLFRVCTHRLIYVCIALSSCLNGKATHWKRMHA